MTNAGTITDPYKPYNAPVCLPCKLNNLQLSHWVQGLNELSAFDDISQLVFE